MVSAQFDDAPVKALQTGHGSSPVEELTSVSRFAQAATPTNRATAHAWPRTPSVMSQHCNSGATAARVHGLIIATSTSPAVVSRIAMRLESNQISGPKFGSDPEVERCHVNPRRNHVACVSRLAKRQFSRLPGPRSSSTLKLLRQGPAGGPRASRTKTCGRRLEFVFFQPV